MDKRGQDSFSVMWLVFGERFLLQGVRYIPTGVPTVVTHTHTVAPMMVPYLIHGRYHYTTHTWDLKCVFCVWGFFCFVLSFLGPHVWHMEVPMLGV